jgi:flagellar basal-body rod modification protein FlgD
MSTVGLDNILASQSTADSTSTNAVKDKISKEKNMFLTLLVKQLEYQDPLDPMKNTEFTAQLAQFSQLETMSDMKASMDKMSTLQTSVNNTQALSFIGKQVDAVGNTLQFSGQPVNLNITLGDKAAQVKVTLYDSDGSPVRSMVTTNAPKGEVACAWDGKGDDGATVSNGKYHYTIEATGYDGKAIATTSYAKGLVTGVRYDSGNIYLEIGDKEVSLADVNKISN